jgi:hypothetical protein
MQIGYYHLCGVDPSVLHHTEFESLYDVFEGAWNRIANAITTAHRFGIGILFGVYYLSVLAVMRLVFHRNISRIRFGAPEWCIGPSGGHDHISVTNLTNLALR